MDGLRPSVILIMLVALAGGVWTRHLHTYSGLVEIRPALENSGLQVTGTFDEPVGNLTGFEVLFPHCPHPLAILPVPAWFMVIIPTEYRYPRGEYDISYVYNGIVYPEEWISYKVGSLEILLPISIALWSGGGNAICILSKNMDPDGLPWHFKVRSIRAGTRLGRSDRA